MLPTDDIDVLVVVPPSAAPNGLVAPSARVVHLADAVVCTAMLVELQARLPRMVGVFGEGTPAVAVASTIYSAGLPVVLFAAEPAKPTAAGLEHIQVTDQPDDRPADAAKHRRQPGDPRAAAGWPQHCYGPAPRPRCRDRTVPERG